jgi:hypothetical protein
MELKKTPNQCFRIALAGTVEHNLFGGVFGG